MAEIGGTEYEDWQFPEYVYMNEQRCGKELAQYQVSILLQAIAALLEKNPRLEKFFKTVGQLKAITSPFV